MPARLSRLPRHLSLPGVVLCLLCLDPLLVAAQDLRFSAGQLQQDFAVLDAAIRNTHPDPSHSTDAAALARTLRVLQQRLGHSMSRDEAWREFATLNPVFADGHFFVGFADWRTDSKAHLDAGGVFFPFEVQVNEHAEVFIKSQLGGSATPAAGARIDTINGVDSRLIGAALLARMHGDTPAFRAQLLSRRWWFYFWKMYGAGTDFELKFTSGGPAVMRVPGSGATPAILVDEASFERQFHLKLLPAHSAVLTVNTFSWPEPRQFFEFTRDAFSKMRTAGVATLVIDVRANGGGDDDMWIQGILPYIATRPYRWGSGFRKRVIEEYRDEGQTIGTVVSGTIDRWIQPEPSNPLRYTGKVYVLVGRSTYSSAILFSNVVQDFDFGTLAGTGGSARADQSGGVQKIVLANTGLVMWWPRFILARPSAAARPAMVQPDIPLQDDPFRPDAAIDELLRAQSVVPDTGT